MKNTIKQSYMSYSCARTFSLLRVKRKRGCAKRYCYNTPL